MIRRAHKILFVAMLLACVIMAVFLIRLRNRAQDRLQSEAAGAPASIREAAGSAPRTLTLYIPNDLDDSLTTVEQSVSLPADENAQARVLLNTLVQTFGAPGSTHPMSVANAVDDVYFLPAPQQSSPSLAQEGTVAAPVPAAAGQIAVVDLSSALAASQPSGIEPETLTLLAMMATLHANIPSISQVHFLVDGHSATTLAGHADLTQTYLASDANPEPTQAAGR